MIENSRFFNQKRFAAVLALFLAWGLIVTGRLVQFQFFLHGKCADPATNPYKVNKPIPVYRGKICDSQMVDLASSVTVKKVIANPVAMKDIPAAARSLAPLLEMDPNVLTKRLSNPIFKNYLVLKRRIDPNLESRILALGIDGIRLEDVSLRVYPNGDLAGPLLGFVNADGIGVAGIERFYNDDLSGNRGMAVSEQDAKGRSYREEMVQPAVPAHSLVLSLDSSIQRLVQRELSSGVQKAHAASGVAIVMESETGRILALASVPGFNPNMPAQYEQRAQRNRAIQDQVEPGSPLKVVVASACLDAGLVRPGELIDCRPGSHRLAGHVIHDHKDFGWLSFEQVLEQSSNNGVVDLGLRLGKERLEKALRSFGIGSRTRIDLWAEASGRLRENKKWSKLSIASLSFGQEVMVTSVQILTAINVIATGGYKVRPTVVDRIRNEKGEPIHIAAPERVRIIRPETAAVVMGALEGVILRGTGTSAALDGYRAAGKTGTAQKAEGGHLSRTNYMASFTGFAPLPKPRVTILVQIDEPRGAIYGGDVAAPVFRKIAQETLLILKAPQDRNLLLAKSGAERKQRWESPNHFSGNAGGTANALQFSIER